MKTSSSLAETVSPEIIKLAAKFIALEETSFSAQAKFLGLNPKQDFRYSDLSGIDFSNCNLCGFDFRGSDLRGAIGLNVLWDETTIFHDADTSNSLFAYRLKLKNIMDEDSKLAASIRRLANNHWAKAIVETDDLLKTAKQNPNSIIIVKAAFDITTDIVVKSNMLYFMRRVADSPSEHRDFIFNIFASHSQDDKILTSAIRTLAALYPNDPSAITLLQRCLESPNGVVRSEALKGLLNTSLQRRSLEEIRRYVLSSENSDFRRRYVARAARLAGPEYVLATTDSDVNNALDFNEPITEAKIHNMARRALIGAKFRRMAADGPQGSRPNLEGAYKIEEKIVGEEVRRYRLLLGQLKAAYGIPFKLEF